MSLPNLSYMLHVARLRYVQSDCEPAESRNPDTFVREFFSPLQRWACRLRGRTLIGRMRSHPFYYYVLARTKYYDNEFHQAIHDGVRYIINVGSGSDTRAYRFEPLLKQKGTRVLECDQPHAILNKKKIASRRWPTDHVDYLPIDLNDASWPGFEAWLNDKEGSAMLVLMEGVSPYVNQEAFSRFLALLGRSLSLGSRIVYDFKLSVADPQFGRSERVTRPFRLPGTWNEVAAYHSTFGYKLSRLELSVDLSRRLLPVAVTSITLPFNEDALVELSLA
jgi:methyltransferase (TIGR00027 family)